MDMSRNPKHKIEEQIEELRKQKILIHGEQKRLQHILDNYDTAPPEPEDNSVLSVHLHHLGADVPLVRRGKTWYVFFPDQHQPAPFTWESLCKYLSMSQHSGVHAVRLSNLWQEEIIPSNTL